MAKGQRYPAESRMLNDERTGTTIRQITNSACIQHHPFFLVPAYDDAMRWLVFVSHRTGAPQIFVEERATGELIQLTDRDDLAEWSIYPSRDGAYVYFTAGTSGWRVRIDTCGEERLLDLGDVAMRSEGMVAAAMGTTALSACDRWWAVRFNIENEAHVAVVDTHSGSWNVVLRKDTVSHMQFCPDDSSLLFCAGPLIDRVWMVNRDGTRHRRLYQRQPNEWITHESWIPGSRELGFIDWPNGIRCINVDTGRERRVTSFNAWHAICNREGTLMVADTNFPDIGLQLFNPKDGQGEPVTLCYPEASSLGAHWNRTFPYANGPITVYAPQHTHPHPSFSPDSRYVVFTSDRTGHAQVYEVEIPENLMKDMKKNHLT